jgi:crotonobetainyl-CoA:carnitine CoA-transferase CaiB-like acyl-CoA transferase
VIAGPFATMQLALQGADVIKIERPGAGDIMRSIMSKPPYSDLGTSADFIAFNLSKRSLTLNLKSGAAQEILMPLIARADVLVESFRPGVKAVYADMLVDNWPDGDVRCRPAISRR